MAFASGVFTRLYDWTDDRDGGVKITASRFDAEMDGMATALSTCLLKDGTQTVTANIPFSGYRLTGIGAATARTDAARADQVQDNGLNYAAVSGTDTYTATLAPAITAYTNGLRFTGKFTNGNTGAATLNLNSVGAVAIRKFHDVALASGDIEANSIVEVVYNSTIPCFEIIGPVASLSAVGTYTVGPGSATDNAIARFDGTGGYTIQNSVVTITDAGALTAAGTGATAWLVQGTGGAVTYRLDRTDTHGDNVLVAAYYGRGKDSDGNTQDYGAINIRAVLDNAGAETGGFEFQTGNAGSLTDRLVLRLGLYTPNATSGDKGADTINASAIYDDGVQLKPTVLGTAAATTSGTAATFSSLPAGIKRIIFMFNEVSLDGTDNLLVQLSTGTTFATSGYVSTSAAIASGGSTIVTSTAGFAIAANNAADITSGHMILTHVGSNLWVASHSGKKSTTQLLTGGGTVTLGGELDGIRVTRSGTNNLDAGSVNIIYE